MQGFYTKINFFITSFISILGFTMIYEVVAEDDFADKIDDFLMLVLGLVAIWWYNKSGKKGKSGTPAVIISGLGVLTKILAMAIEHADKKAMGDDVGIMISLLLAFGLVVYQVYFTKKSSS